MIPALLLDATGIGPAGAAPALDAVRLRVAPGERVAILGGNGAGKTTLLKAVMGLVRPRGGEVRVFGRPVRCARDAVAAGAGLLMQDPHDQLLGATVLEDARFGPENQGASPSEARRRALAALHRTGMAPLADRPIERLSFGEKKRAGLAGVLAMEPRLLLLDEPTAGLDPAAEQAALEVLAALSAAGVTLVAATHAVDVVPAFADRVVLLGDRGVLADGPARQVFADAPLLARAALRPPWPVALWRARGGGGPVPLTLEEVTTWNAPRS